MAMSRRKEVGSAQAKPPPTLVSTRYSALFGREGELSTSAYLILSGDFSLPACSEEGGDFLRMSALPLVDTCPSPPLVRARCGICAGKGWETCVEPPSSEVKRGVRGAFAGGGTQSA